jgi:hypothetical protein
MLRVSFVSSSARSTPISESGRLSMMAKGCVKLSNWLARIRKMRMTASRIASITYPPVSASSSVSPPSRTV